ncbi:hypothetical protein TNIN_359951 [Trichonephila inaurata madagascariensis]|uniref:Uncharacterized protein n=1 Tax=Trichonephila inaurata madagascariensis TaxID=2747483 RepID=A0A8X6YUS2_9ARAC|nr:hypothetical protein TNIN_359951 [Trichonephila inaurata madagascariensis]
MIHPGNVNYNRLITNFCESLVAASKPGIDILQVFHNRALRLITGAVKSTPIDGMLLSTHQRLIKSIVVERALLLWEKTAIIPDCLSLWKDSLSYININLKLQRGRLQKVMALKEFHSFNFKPENPIKSSCLTERYDFALSTEMIHEIQKKETDSRILRVFSWGNFG